MSRIASALLGATALVAVSAAPAFAQSAFDGPYAGAALGYSWLNTELTNRIGAAGTERIDDTRDGVTGTAFWGYGATFDGLYLGGEMELGYADQDQTFRVGTNPYSFESGLTYGVALRAGVLADKDTLVYGRLGWQRSEVDFESRLNNVVTVGGVIPTVDESETLDGWRIGGGVERAYGNILARIEYTYTGYEDADFSYTAPAGLPGGTFARADVETDEHAVRVGVAYRF